MLTAPIHLQALHTVAEFKAESQYQELRVCVNTHPCILEVGHGLGQKCLVRNLIQAVEQLQRVQLQGGSLCCISASAHPRSSHWGSRDSWQLKMFSLSLGTCSLKRPKRKHVLGAPNRSCFPYTSNNSDAVQIITAVCLLPQYTENCCQEFLETQVAAAVAQKGGVFLKNTSL